MAPGKEEFQNITLHLSKQLERLGVRVFLGEEVTPEFVLQEDPDITIIATGAVPLIPELPGIFNKNVVTPFQVLNGDLKLGEKVVIIGGGGIGCEVALFVAKMGAMDPEKAVFLAQWGALDPNTAVSLTLRGIKEVTILEQLPSIGKDIGITKRKFIQQSISMCGVKVITEAHVKRILALGVEILNKEGEQQIISADTVVIAAGTRADNKLYEALKGKVSKLSVIGDAKKPQKALDAIYEGATLSM